MQWFVREIEELKLVTTLVKFWQFVQFSVQIFRNFFKKMQFIAFCLEILTVYLEILIFWKMLYVKNVKVYNKSLKRFIYYKHTVKEDYFRYKNFRSFIYFLILKDFFKKIVTSVLTYKMTIAIRIFTYKGGIFFS